MATTADQRLLDLLEKWLKSLDLHLGYSSLDDTAYWKVQPWVPHQRPTRWIIELAKQKTVALKRQIEERALVNDEKFSESLELMIFLANLVGSQHIERFIPLAEPESENAPLRAPPDLALSMSDQSPTASEPVLDLERMAEAATGDLAAAGGAAQATGTREMPKFPQRELREPPATGTQTVARTERKGAAAAKPLAGAAGPGTAGPGASGKGPPAKTSGRSPPPPISTTARDQVIADAVRLVQWGRNWFELAELIARMADRPTLTEVRRILTDNKSTIDEKAGRR